MLCMEVGTSNHNLIYNFFYVKLIYKQYIIFLTVTIILLSCLMKNCVFVKNLLTQHLL